MSFFNSTSFRFIHIAVVLVAAGFSLYSGNLQAQQVAPYLKNKNYGIQLGMYDLFTSTQADVIMLGNSLTYNANWNEILNRSNIANRGIASDITSGYLHRLEYVYRLKPRICFIEGGVNDLYSNDSVRNIIRNYVGIIDSLQSHYVVPVIQSTLFVAAKYPQAREKNKQTQTLNNWLRNMPGSTRSSFSISMCLSQRTAFFATILPMMESTSTPRATHCGLPRLGAFWRNTNCETVQRAKPESS